MLNFDIPCRAVWRKVADSLAGHNKGESLALSLIGDIGENTRTIDNCAIRPKSGYHLLRIVIKCKDAEGTRS